jgi:hypothetical protein
LRIDQWMIQRILLATAFLTSGCLTHQYRSKPRVAVVDGDPIVQMKSPDSFPVVIKPSLVLPRQHSDPPDADSRVLGLAVGAVPRAYPIGLLDRFEVVNDAVPGLPFVVARCALTGVAAVYDRRAGGRVLEFRNSGTLWRDTLVLQDLETGTDWSAATGRALHGPLAGERLSPVPAVLARVSDWERTFPASLYMDLDRDTSVPLLMRLYGASNWQGLSGRTTRDSRHRPKETVFAVAEDDEALAFTAGEIEAAGRLDASVHGTPVSIRWDAALEAPRAWGADGKEMAVVPMFWFAAAQHYAHLNTLSATADKSNAR